MFPGVGIWEIPLDDVIVGLPVSVPPSNGIDVLIVYHRRHAGTRVPHVGTQMPAVFHRVVALHCGMVDGAILTAHHVDLPVHSTGTGSGSSDVHVRDGRPDPRARVVGLD